MKDINPPAQSCSSVKELVATARHLAAEITKASKMNVTRAVEIGKIVNQLAAQCSHGELLKAYEEIGITRQRASEFGRAAKCPPVDISKWTSLNHLREAIMEEKPETAPVQAEEEDKPPAELQAQRAAQYGGKQGVAAAALASISPAPDKQKLCDRCRANPRGPVKDCQACASLTRPAERDAGDDTEQIAAEKRAERQAVREHNRSNGRYFDPKAFTDPLGKLVRALDDFGAIYQIKESTEVAALRRRMEELLTEFQNLAKKTAKMEVK